MKKTKVMSAKRSFFMSVVSLVLCFAMLLGTTYAWFTDEVTSGTNKIIAGNLDVELLHQGKNDTTATSVENETKLFDDITLWEPGAYVYETFTVKNVGNLALKYKMALNVAAFTSYNGHNLTEVLKVATLDSVPTSREQITGGTALKDWHLDATDTPLYPVGSSLGTTSEKTFTVAIYWEPTDHDNDFNMNNGRPQPLSVDLGVKLVATQLEAESDSFGSDYDAGTVNTLPEATKYDSKLAEAKSEKTTVSETGDTSIKAAATPTTSTVAERQDTTVTFPEGALTANKDAVLSVKTTNTLFAVTSAGAQVASVDLGLTVDGQPVANFNGKTVTVETYISAGLTSVSVAYNGTGDQPTDINYVPETGKLTFKTTHFSEYDVRGSAIAYILGDKDTGFVGYAAAAEAAKEEGVQVELTADADMKKAAEAAEEKGASFVIPTQVVQNIEKTGKTDEKVQSNFEARIGTQYFATLGGAIKAAQSGATIDLLSMTVTADVHEKLDKSLTINGNGASFASAVEFDLGTYFDYSGDKRVIKIDNLGKAGVWGNVDANAQIDITLTNCKDVHEVLVQQGSGATVNTTVKNCTFDGKNAAGMTGISQDCGGSVTVESCTFANMLCGVNVKNDYGTLAVSIKGCTFTDCGLTTHTDNEGNNTNLGAAIRRGAKTGASGSLTVENCKFVYSNSVEKILGADIIIGENRAANDGSGVIAYEITSTDAVVKVYEAHASNSTSVEERTETATTAKGVSGDNKPTPTASTAAELTTALANGGKVKLTADISASAGFTVSKDSTIDFNGKKLTFGTAINNNSQGFLVEEGAALNITDSAATPGKVVMQYANANWATTFIKNSGGTVTFDKITVMTTSGNFKGVVQESGSFTMNGGEINATHFGVHATTGSVTINGGTLKSTSTKGQDCVYLAQTAALTVTGGNIVKEGSGSAHCISMTNNCTANISGGTMSISYSTSYVLFADVNAQATVTGGEFIAPAGSEKVIGRTASATVTAEGYSVALMP